MAYTTMQRLENQIQTNLDSIGTMEEGDQNRKRLIDETNQLLDRLIQMEKDQNDAWDKQERRKLEYNKNRDTLELERLKITSMPWKRAAVEIAKVAVPTILSGGLFWLAQTRVLKFEETGRFTSTASRQLGSPKIFK